MSKLQTLDLQNNRIEHLNHLPWQLGMMTNVKHKKKEKKNRTEQKRKEREKRKEKN